MTAPLRRLADRFATEACLAIVAGVEVPEWVGAALPELPALMAQGDHLAHGLDRAVVDATEAFVLSDRIGDTFDASVLETGDRYGTVVLTVADVALRRVRFERVA